MLGASPKATVQLRPFKSEDVEALSRLFSLHTTYQRDAAFWLWLNRLLPVRPAIAAVAVDAGKVVGHYSILPFELKLPDGTHSLAGHGVHAFVSPFYRDRVNIFQVSAQAYQLASDAGLAAVFGFPNARYRLVQEKIERWRSVAVFKAWTKPPVNCIDDITGRLEPADMSDDTQLHQAICLWENLDATSTGLIVMGQLARWWMLRYVLHPQKPYSLFWYVNGGERCGLIVAKYYQAEQESRAHVVDYVLLDAASTPDMLKAFSAWYRGKVDRCVHWPTDPAFTQALRETGYQEDGFETYFGVRRLKPTGAGSDVFDTLASGGAWRLPMGLSDAF